MRALQQEHAGTNGVGVGWGQEGTEGGGVLVFWPVMVVVGWCVWCGVGWGGMGGGGGVCTRAGRCGSERSTVQRVTGASVPVPAARPVHVRPAKPQPPRRRDAACRAQGEQWPGQGRGRRGEASQRQGAVLARPNGQARSRGRALERFRRAVAGRSGLEIPVEGWGPRIARLTMRACCSVRTLQPSPRMQVQRHPPPARASPSMLPRRCICWFKSLRSLAKWWSTRRA